MEWMFMPLKRYAEFSGRSRRKEYWMWTLFQVLLYVGVLMLMMVVGGGAIMTGGDPSAVAAAGGAAMIILALYGLAALAFLIPGIAVTIRRLHDTGRSGWWLGGLFGLYILLFLVTGMALTSGDPEGGGMLSMILSLVIFAYAIAMLVFMLLDGTKGPNKYGPDPKGGVDADKVFA
ncbi:MAG TPA: DUF805 domain-containing protein [Allosphingosinicella sp.]